MQKDESGWVPLVIYGVPFHNVTFEEAISWIIERARSGRPTHVVTANLDFVMQARRDPALQRILLEADLVLADGFPIVKLSPFWGPKLKERVTGSDLTPRLAKRAAQEGLSLFGLGSTAEEALEILKECHPDLKVAGTFSPSYAPLQEMEHQEILQRLEKTNPDILFVALGSPKQEMFIRMHLRNWKVPVAIGVGASLDFITGKQRRAPVWVQRCLLEWFWRIFTNPKRLLGRYMANLHFLFTATRQMIQIRRMPDLSSPFHPLEKADFQRLEKKGVTIVPFQSLEADTLPDHPLLIDLHSIPWLDSQELGMLLVIAKRCHSQGKPLILYAPRPKVVRLLETSRLTRYFDIVSRPCEIHV